MTDEFATYREGLSDPADNQFAITPSDTVDMAFVARGIYVGVTGDIAIVTKDDSVVTYKNCVQGSILPVRAKRINATNTTATDLVGLH